jgi:hypothetical protein
MGLWDSITDAADAIGDAASDVAESAYNSVTTSAIGDTIAWAAETVDTATFGLAGQAMNAADDYVFDTVDYVTGGGVNIDFDDGQFSVGTGFDGLAKVSASVGEAGITTGGEVPFGAYDFGMTDDGFLASGSAGINWGPLPYASGHVQLDEDGNVSVNGEVQGTFPTYYGIVTGEVKGGFETTEEGWGTYIDAEGKLYTPTGMTIGAGVEASYQETEDGSFTSVAVEGSVGMVGYGTASAGVGYDRLEHDGDVVENVHLEGEVDALGVVTVSGEADYAHSNIDGVEQSDWSGDVGIDGPDLSDVGTIANIASSQFGGSDEMLGIAEFDSVPVDDFSQALDTADSIDDSLDNLVQDLQ